MKKLTISLVCAAFVSGYANAAPVEFGGLNFELDETEKTATLVAGEYTASDVVIPETISIDGADYAVTSVGEKAFFQNTAITTLTLPNSIGIIGPSAFMGCRNLATINWGSGIHTVETSAFGADTHIATVNITDLKSWAETEFANDYAAPVNYSKKLTLNGEVITELVIPDDAEKIGNYTFCNVNKLTSVTIGSGVKSIGEKAFYYCYNIGSLTIPDNVTELKKGAFSSLRGMTSLTIGSGLEAIPEEAFVACTSLTTLDIPDNIKSIGMNAFKSCSGVTTVNLGSGVNTISKDAFILSSKINTVTAKSLDQWCRIDFETMASNPVYFSKSLTIDGEVLTNVTFPEGIGKVKNFTFHSLSTLESITVPDDVTEIGASAFYLCSALKTINLPEGITEIGGSAFQSCTSLTEITLPKNLENISGNLFNRDTALTSVTLPESLKTIGDFAFGGCTGLVNLAIPAGVTNVGAYAFQGCSSIERLVFPKTAATFGSSSLSNCSALKYLEFQAPQITFGYNAIANCPSLEQAWVNTATASYKTFPATVTLYVPYGSIENWREQYPNNELKETGYIDIDAEQGVTTYYIFASYTMPEGMEGCAIAGVYGNKLVKGNVFAAGETVPYDTPLLITGTYGDFRMFEVERNTSDRFDGENLLRGSNKDDVVMKDPAYSYFLLGYDEYETTFGFMPVLDNGGFEIAAHKAFLALPAAEANEDGYLIEFVEEPQIPEKLYLVGLVNGWPVPDESNAELLADYVLDQTAEGSGVYTGEFEFVEAQNNAYRFYSNLDGWDNSSIGSQEQDEMMPFTFTDDTYTGSLLIGGKGSWQLPENFRGKVSMTVNLIDKTVTYVGTQSGSGIEIVSDDENKTLTIYSIDGRLVKADGILELEPGIYIINGRKTVITK